jgi:hypothetical protein
MNYFHTKINNLILINSSGVGVGVRQIDERVPSSNHRSVGIHQMHKVWLSFCAKNLSIAPGEEIIYRKCPLSSEISGRNDVFIK